jgi:hypothetical protein
MQTLIHIGCSARLSRNVRVCNFLLCSNPLARKMGSKHRGDSEVVRLSRLRIVQQISSLRSRDSRKVDSSADERVYNKQTGLRANLLA